MIGSQTLLGLHMKDGSQFLFVFNMSIWFTISTLSILWMV